MIYYLIYDWHKKRRLYLHSVNCGGGWKTWEASSNKWMITNMHLEYAQRMGCKIVSNKMVTFYQAIL